MHLNIFGFLSILLTLAGCLNGPGFMQQKNLANLSETDSKQVVPIESTGDGVITAKLDASSGATQVISASGDSGVGGSEISFPPGSLAINTDVTVEEGSQLVTDGTAQELGISSGDLTSASSALVISSSANIDASQPFTVSLVLDGSGLLLNQQLRKLVILYKIKKAEQGGQMFVGIIPDNRVTISGNKISFATAYFGSYQAVYTTIDIAAVAEKTSSQPIVTKNEAKVAENNSGTSDTGNTAGTGTNQLIPGNPLNVTVQAVTASSIQLGWKAVSGAQSYLISASSSGAPGDFCKTNFVGKVDGQSAAFTFKIENLNFSNNYIVRICSVSASGTASSGTLTSGILTLDRLPINPSDLTLAVSSSRHLHFSWTHPTSAPAAYVIAWNQGPYQGGTATMPLDCVSAEKVRNVGFTNSIVIGEFRGDAPVAVRVCAKNLSGQLSSGVTTNAMTHAFALNCDVGNLDTDCTISSSHPVPAGGVVSGLGNLIIADTGAINAGIGSPLIIDMKGRVELQRSSPGNYGKIDATGAGHAGGLNGTNGGAGGGPGAGKFVTFAGTGAAFGGEGGYNRAAIVSVADIPMPYGDWSFPVQLGSGGGAGASTGGAGGGHITIRASELINRGSILANGTAGFSADDGGGSGGSILIQVAKISSVRAGGAVVGFIKAKGGNAGSGEGGAGSGGRIAIHHDSAAGSSLNDIALWVDGGAANCGSSACDGAAGTTFVFDKNNSFRILNITASAFPRPGTHARTTLDFAASPLVQKLDQLNVNGFAVLTLKNPQPVTLQIGALTVGSSAAIDHSGLGARGASANDPFAGGTGAGGNGSSATGSGGGGGNGGSGGMGAGGGQAGLGGAATNDLITQPVSPGSGGGMSHNLAAGGNGGGALKLVITGIANIEGEIRANGGDSKEQSAYCGGGGSGGSIWLKAAEVNAAAAHDAFFAAGGSGSVGSCSGDGGGGGGGGRIYIDSPVISPNIHCKIAGGMGINLGGSGAAHRKSSNTTAVCAPRPV